MLVALFSVAAFAQKKVPLLQPRALERTNVQFTPFTEENAVKHASRRAEGIVVTPPEGLVTEDYEMTAAYYDNETNGEDVSRTIQIGINGIEVYIKGFSVFLPNAWIKGFLSLDQTQISIPSPQYYGYLTSGGNDYDIYFIYERYASQADDTFPTELVLDYNAETGDIALPQGAYNLFLEGSQNVNDFACYGYSLVSRIKKAGEKPEPVVAPADLVAEEWAISYNNNKDEASSGALKIGFSGNDVYMQGLCSFVPEAWIKGTLDGNTITFPGWQYFGTYSKYEMFLQEDAVVFTYDAEAGKMTAVNEVIATYTSTMLKGDTYKNAVITKVLEKAATPATPLISEIMESSYGPVVIFEVPTVDVDGNGLLTSKLSFQFFKDIEEEISVVTFDPADYKNLTEATTVIPYGFTDDYDFFATGIYLNQQDFSQWNKIGIQSIYTGGGEEHKSEIYWLTIKEYQKAIFDFNAMTDEPTSNNGNEGDITADRQFTANGVTLTVSPSTGNTPNRFWSTNNGPQLRVYGGTLTFEAPVGKVLTKIVFNNGKWNDKNSADTGAFEGNVWTGNAQKVVVTIAGNTQLNNIVVYPGDDVPTVVEVPEGLAIEAYVFKATAVEAKQDPADEVAEPYNNIVQIGFDGNDAYIQGLNGDDPDQWVKATKNEAGQYVIPANQYMGTIDLFGMYYFDYFFTAVDAEGNMVDAVFDFDAEKSLFTNAQTLVLNGAVSELDPYITFTDVTIEKFVEVAATPADPTIEAVNFADTSYPNIYCSIPAVGSNGEVLNPSKLFYTVWIEKNGEKTPYTFTAAAYNQDFTEDVTEVPYTHDGYDIYSGGEIIYFEESLEELATWTKVGIQTIYKGAGEEHKSNIVWLDNATAISAVKADNGKAVIFNLAGQRLSAPQKGLNIINGRKVMIK